MLVRDLKPGNKFFIIDWNLKNYQLQINISEIKKVENIVSDHCSVELYAIIGCYENYEIYNKLDLNNIYIEHYYWDDSIAFITCNEQLFIKIYRQLLRNKTWDKTLIRRVLYYY